MRHVRNTARKLGFTQNFVFSVLPRKGNVPVLLLIMVAAREIDELLNVIIQFGRKMYVANHVGKLLSLVEH